jgi:hypothetical protein
MDVHKNISFIFLSQGVLYLAEFADLVAVAAEAVGQGEWKKRMAHGAWSIA